MKLFVLPSWYPSAAQPMAGLFVRDQVAALAADASMKIVVGGWGHHDGALSVRQPATSLAALRWRVRARPAWRDAGTWHEFNTPRLSWSLRIGLGGVRGLLQASRGNLAQAREFLGGIDLIHAHVGFPAGWIAAELARETGLPYVLTEHMSPFPVPQLLQRGAPVAALRAAYAGAAATVAVSPALAGRIRALGLPCSDVVPNAVDTERFALQALPHANPFVLLTLGTLTRQKGVDVLLAAFARWHAPQAQLHIGGDGPERAALERQAQALGIAARVRFLGALAPGAVPAAMAACHVFVLASRHETFGVVLAEALASGRPVLATRCGGPQAIVGAGDGLLVPPEDAAALAAALQQMAGLSFDATALRARAVERFSRAAVARQLMAIYCRVLGR